MAPRLSAQLILSPVSKTNKKKAEAMLSYIDDSMDWNDRGEIIVNGSVVHGSHVSDLLNHALVRSVHFHPTGCELFYTSLARAPLSLFHPCRRELIGNGKESWSHTSQELKKRLPPPGIPVNNPPVDLMDPNIWTNKWRPI